jgi:hypothetical protein
MIDQELIERLRGFYVYSQSQDKIAFVEDIFEKIKESGYKTSQAKILKGLSTLGKVKKQNQFKTIRYEIRGLVGKANFYYYLWARKKDRNLHS